MHCHNQTFAETVFLQKEKVGGYSLAVLFFNVGLPRRRNPIPTRTMRRQNMHWIHILNLWQQVPSRRVCITDWNRHPTIGLPDQDTLVILLGLAMVQNFQGSRFKKSFGLSKASM